MRVLPHLSFEGVEAAPPDPRMSAHVILVETVAEGFHSVQHVGIRLAQTQQEAADVRADAIKRLPSSVLGKVRFHAYCIAYQCCDASLPSVCR